MSPIFKKVFWLVMLLMIVSLACSLPIIAQKTKDVQPTTVINISSTPSNTAASAITQEPALSEATVTIEVTPTDSVTETPTLPVGVFPTDTPTPTPVPILAKVAKETNCRIGPGPHYDLVATYQAGTTLQVIARDLGGGYIFTMNSSKPEEVCYILANNVTISGDTAALPQITPLSSPTSAPNFTAVFKKFDTCKGHSFPQFIIQNTGSVAFRSVYIKASNLKSGESTEKVANAFDLMTGCIIARNVAPLEAGGTGYLSAEPFEKDPRGSNMRAIIQACTEQNLKGFCINAIVQIKP